VVVARYLRPRAWPLGFCHSFRLQINSVNLVPLDCHNQRSISNVQRFDKNPLNVLLERWVNPIREDRQIPKSLFGADIPRLNVCATTIIIWSDVSNALIDHRLDLCWRDTLGDRQTWQEQRRPDKNNGESWHKREGSNEREISHRRVSWQTH
jgi:hypothetical protein